MPRKDKPQIKKCYSRSVEQHVLPPAGHSEQDSFINKAHSEKLHKAYAGDKNLILFEGDHNSHRPQFFYASALIFLNTVLQIDRHLPPAEAEATAEREGQ